MNNESPMSTGLYVFLKLLSYIPVFRVTDDDNFGTIRKNSNEFRVSLVSLNVGPWIVFLCSFGFARRSKPEYKAPKKFRLFYMLDLMKSGRTLSDEKYEDLKTKHESFLLYNEDPNKRNALKDTLLYKINQVMGKSNQTFNKFVAYLAAIAFILPLFIPSALKLTELGQKPIPIQIGYGISAAYLALNFMNIFLLFFYFIKVKTTSRFLYSSVKNADDPEAAYLNGVYMDYQQRDVDSTNQVSLILNVERYMMGIIILGLLLIATHNLDGAFGNRTTKDIITVGDIQVLHLDVTNSAAHVFKKNAEMLQTIQKDLLEHRIEQIIVIRTKDDEEANAQRVTDFFRVNNVHGADIQIVIGNPGPQAADGTIQLVIERR
ncbi:hypothetical protein MALU111345_18570 [Marinicrinis lubricantis]